MILKSKVIPNQNVKHLSKSPSSRASVYILSAVRTPIGLPRGILNVFSGPQLGSFAFREAMLRAVVPPKDFQNIFMGCDLQGDYTNEIINRTGLSKSTKLSSVSLFGMKNLTEAITSMVKGNHVVSMAGGIDSASNLPTLVSQKYVKCIGSLQENIRNAVQNNVLKSDLVKYAERDHKNFFEANKSGAFFEEIVKINFIRKGQKINIMEDETLDFLSSTREISPKLVDGAVAIVMSTEELVRSNNLNPLGKIISFSEVAPKQSNPASVECLAIEKALEAGNCQCNEISRWEIDSIFDAIYNIINYFKIDPALVNKDGGVFSLGFPVGMSGLKAVCHLIHSMKDGELGCAVACDFDGSASAVIIQKLHADLSSKPQLTLYTKSGCSLCEELKEELVAFKDRFSLKEIDIEAEENKNYEDLFQYDIPVLFMDGRFLCKHKLDAQHFSRRLAACGNFYR